MTASERAHVLLDRVRALHDEWALVARGLGEDAVHAPSALPGWTRAHLLSHVARNADGLGNLLTWAKTGVETPMYDTATARDEGIEAGADRSAAVIVADVVDSGERFAELAASMPDEAWAGEARDRLGNRLTGEGVLLKRLSETSIHLVDLDSGYDFDRVSGLLGREFEVVVSGAIAWYGDGLPAVLLVAVDGDGTRHEWRMGTGDPAKVTGAPGDVLAWITGRSDGSTLDGEVPPLPHWL
ncbi:maleylpyruvate isomerase N-terminal domain-containing protein [Amycolatopsis sp. BJA-103]|uniref:maleylpyruvate isomerase N-terminal domain-containing protein n=1 Tax=Amycolatopsis sp. BJA-103 TaxID=1911175 RepID=UPI000C77FEAC|nr:maleylpyruvate isomerase N-terminal domain-containing protein [Amycolatopsis sp. BJA-103]AUI63368.1 maleylpyruvate isomerase [Amycolatopsis sp. BJA-103]PNE19213.1 maleylpyruvate isomerase [Amycolatopsis sp. BJA-103]